MSRIDFVPLGIADLPELYAIELLSFSQPWPEQAYQTELADNAIAHYWGCRVDGRLAAFAGLWQIVDEGHITNIATHPDFRQQGLAEWLLRMMQVELMKMGISSLTLEVRSKNSPAINLYRKLGFVEEGVRTGYYDCPPDDALIMWWKF